jgi:hypothetical protein
MALFRRSVFLAFLAGEFGCYAGVRPLNRPDMSKPIAIDKRPGWSRGTVYRQDGRGLDWGPLEEALANDPATGPAMAGYGTKTGLGAFLVQAGLALIVGGFVEAKGVPRKSGDWVLPLAGLTTFALAVPVFISSDHQLQTAVEAHNARLGAASGAYDSAALEAPGIVALMGGTTRRQCAVAWRLTF